MGETIPEETPEAMKNIDDILSLSGSFKPGNTKDMIERALDSGVDFIELLSHVAHWSNQAAKGKKHAQGWEKKDYWHRKNPESKSRHDYYLDKSGKAVRKGSHESHIEAVKK